MAYRQTTTPNFTNNLLRIHILRCLLWMSFHAFRHCVTGVPGVPDVGALRKISTRVSRSHCVRLYIRCCDPLLG